MKPSQPLLRSFTRRAPRSKTLTVRPIPVFTRLSNFASHSQQTTSLVTATSIPLRRPLHTTPILTSNADDRPSSNTPRDPVKEGASTAAVEEGEGEVMEEMSDQEREITELLSKRFEGGKVAVQDVSGGCGTFFAISLAHPSFKGLPTIKQHRLVNEALGNKVKEWHGVQLKTVAI